MIDGLHLLRPYWLLLLPLAGLLVWLVVLRQRKHNTWQLQCDPLLLEAQLQEGMGARHRLPFFILAGGWILAIVALAGPSWHQQAVPVFNELNSRIIIFDLSRSMDSDDLAPSRLIRARYKLNDLVNGAGARQQSLVVFAGDSFVVSPFTDDRDTLTNLIPSLNTSTVPVQGSRVDKALLQSMELIANAGVHHVQIVLITDGVNEQSQQLARQLSEQGHELDVIAAGTEEGAPVALAEGGLLKDGNGNIVVPGVDHQELRNLAASGNGYYFDLAADNSDVEWLNGQKNLTTDTVADEVKNAVPGSRGTLRWLDSGIWLLVPLALLASFGFRRGALLVVVVAVSMQSHRAMAFGWPDLWLRADQQAHQALESNQPESVPGRADPGWRGVAAYKQQDYESASKLFAEGDDVDSAFNSGNALAYSGQLEQAIAAYIRALNQNPQMEDAKRNLELVKSLLEQQQKQQDKQSGQQNPQQGEGKDNRNASRPGDPNPDQPSQQANTQSNESDSAFNDNNQQDKDYIESKNELENQQTAESGQDPPAPAPGQPGTSSEPIQDPITGLMSEDQQALQQWLKQVPDDPGGLLQRKFRYQYSQRPQQPTEAEKW